MLAVRRLSISREGTTRTRQPSVDAPRWNPRLSWPAPSDCRWELVTASRGPFALADTASGAQPADGITQ